MPLAQDNIGPDTPLGATLTADGATFRVWAPRARAVYLRVGAADGWAPGDDNLLVKDEASGTWAGFVPFVQDGDPYRFYVVGDGGEGLKRDPRARELGANFPDCDCFVRDPAAYPWHDEGYRPPPFNDLVIYQFHVGTYYAVDADGNDARAGGARFLDVIGRVPYLAGLGVNAIEPLPIVEFETHYSMGYNGTDDYSPEMSYEVPAADLGRYRDAINALLASKGLGPPLTTADLASQSNQLKALVDVCHAFGIAVLFDVVYNHAGGGFDDQSLYFLDRAPNSNNNNSLYFTDQGWAGGLVFAYWNADVRQYLIDNAKFFVEEYHADGFRFDEVTVIDGFGGWGFCQDLTNTLRFLNPAGIQVAEYWGADPSWAIKSTSQGGAGFDAVWHAALRDALRGAIAQAASGRETRVDLDAVAAALGAPPGFPASWRAVQHLENHDLVYAGHDDRVPRVAALGDATDHRSWYARSRARVANGLLLTAPGIPLLFMGQEFLEDKPWSDSPDPSYFLWWAGLDQDKAMDDHLLFLRDLLAVRRRQPALRGEGLNPFHVHDDNRVLAFQRWVEGVGRDVVVVASLNESTFYGYQLGFPSAGRWLEVFNGDLYDTFPNPVVAGNGGSVEADGPPLHGLAASASIVIPADGLLVFARDEGDPR
jgi:1,4-alpha-glucan branching enzyme